MLGPGRIVPRRDERDRGRWPRMEGACGRLSRERMGATSFWDPLEKFQFRLTHRRLGKAPRENRRKMLARKALECRFAGWWAFTPGGRVSHVNPPLVTESELGRESAATHGGRLAKQSFGDKGVAKLELGNERRCSPERHWNAASRVGWNSRGGPREPRHSGPVTELEFDYVSFPTCGATVDRGSYYFLHRGREEPFYLARKLLCRK